MEFGVPNYWSPSWNFGEGGNRAERSQAVTHVRELGRSELLFSLVRAKISDAMLPYLLKEDLNAGTRRDVSLAALGGTA